jgi:hypothetical protein
MIFTASHISKTQFMFVSCSYFISPALSSKISILMFALVVGTERHPGQRRRQRNVCSTLRFLQTPAVRCSEKRKRWRLDVDDKGSTSTSTRDSTRLVELTVE